MLDDPVIVTFLVRPITLGKTSPWHLAMFMKIPLKMTQNIIISYFAIIPP